MPGEVIDPLDILEARVKLLELKVFGETENNYETPTDIVDMLLKSQTLMTTAITSHDKINKMVKRLDQLELVLDPLYEDTLLDRETKIEMVLLAENQLHETLMQLKSLKELSSVLESEQIRNILKVEQRLDALVSVQLENKKRVDEVTKDVNSLLKHYSDVMNSFTKTFAQLNETITDLEVDAQPKQVMD